LDGERRAGRPLIAAHLSRSRTASQGRRAGVIHARVQGIL